MGVPQRRERTFFIGRRRDLTMTPITLEFNEQPISAADAVKNVVLRGPRPLTETAAKYWYLCKPGSSFASIHPTQSLFNWIKLAPNIPANTITSSGAPMIFHWSEPRVMDNAELVRLQTFPDDYNSLETDLGYVVGMSVPPFMMQRVANRIANHFFSKNTA
jgi:DNA (cytosine-5)-methyltransferase 1